MGTVAHSNHGSDQTVQIRTHIPVYLDEIGQEIYNYSKRIKDFEWRKKLQGSGEEGNTYTVIFSRGREQANESA
jgi:hypothetical protein